MVAELGYLHAGTSVNFEQAKQHLKQLNAANQLPDVFLLDITLGSGMGGIEVAQLISTHYYRPYVYVTGHHDKPTIQKAALTGAMGYLLKDPQLTLDPTVLYATLELALANYKSNAAASAGLFGQSFFVKENHFMVKVEVAAIMWVQSFRNYLEVATAQKKHIVRSTLKDFLAKLPGNRFLQVHRSYAINLQHLQQVGHNHAIVGGQNIPVSKTYKETLVKQVE